MVKISKEVMEKARELAGAIIKTDQFKTLRKTEAAAHEDKEARNILEQFAEIQEKTTEAKEKGIELTPEEKQNRQNIELNIQNNETIKAYIEAQKEFRELMEKVDVALTSRIYQE